MAVRWTNQAKLDLQEITQFYLVLGGSDLAKRKIFALLSDIKSLAITPMVGSKDERLDEEYQYWYALGTEHRLYFKRLGPRTIELYRIWPSRRRPLRPDEINP